MTTPNIVQGQIAIDPKNGILFYRNDSNVLVNTTLHWFQYDTTTTSTVDNVKLQANITIDGDLIVNGTQTSVESTTIYVKDPVFTLGGNANPTSDDNKDRGIEFRWHNGSTAKKGFFGFDDSIGKFTFIPDATGTNEVYSGTTGELSAKVDWSNIINKDTLVNSITGTSNEIEVNSNTGNVTIGLPATINANTTGTAAALTNARTISLTGEVTGSTSFDGSGNVSIATTIQPNSFTLGTDTTGDYVANITSGTGITITDAGGEAANPTIAVTSNTFDAYGSAAAAQSTAIFNAASALADHEANTTSIHGISNTAALVTLTGTQTLTNKTLTSPTITGISPVINLAGDLSGSATLTNLSGATLTALIEAQTIDETHLSYDFEYVQDLTAGDNILITNTYVGIGALKNYSIATSANPSFDSISTESCVIDNIEIDPTGASVGQILKFNGNKFVPGVDNVAAAGLLNIEDLSNVTITSVSSGQVLKWNGSAWVNAEDVAGTTINSLDDIGDVNITTVQNGDLLKWNGSAWVNAGGYALLASPTFTGTVSGITKTMVGLGNVDDTSDADKPVSTAAQTALDLKAPLASPTFTGTVSGITKTMVGLNNVNNTSDANKPISNSTQTALDLKANLDSPTFTGTVTLPADAVGSLDDIGDVTILTSILQAGQRSYI